MANESRLGLQRFRGPQEPTRRERRHRSPAPRSPACGQTGVPRRISLGRVRQRCRFDPIPSVARVSRRFAAVSGGSSAAGLATRRGRSARRFKRNKMRKKGWRSWRSECRIRPSTLSDTPSSVTAIGIVAKVPYVRSTDGRLLRTLR
jgi:hypothetical protein